MVSWNIKKQTVIQSLQLLWNKAALHYLFGNRQLCFTSLNVETTRLLAYIELTATFRINTKNKYLVGGVTWLNHLNSLCNVKTFFHCFLVLRYIFYCMEFLFKYSSIKECTLYSNTVLLKNELLGENPPIFELVVASCLCKH